MNKMGLEVISFTIKEVRDKNEYITNMGKPDVARIKRDADVPPPKLIATPPSASVGPTGIRSGKSTGGPGAGPRETLPWPSKRKPSATSKSRKRSTSKSPSGSSAGGQSLRHPSQHHAAAGHRRAGEGATDRERATG